MSPEEFANAEDWERQTWDKDKPKSKKVWFKQQFFNTWYHPSSNLSYIRIAKILIFNSCHTSRFTMSYPAGVTRANVGLTIIQESQQILYEYLHVLYLCRLSRLSLQRKRKIGRRVLVRLQPPKSRSTMNWSHLNFTRRAINLCPSTSDSKSWPTHLELCTPQWWLTLLHAYQMEWSNCHYKQHQWNWPHETWCPYSIL
jgi:hypothetical protein